MSKLIERVLIMLSFGLSQEACAASAEVTVPNGRLCVAVDEKLPAAQQVESIHAAVKGLGDLVGKEKLALLPYVDASGERYENISAFPFMVIKGTKAKLQGFSDPSCTVFKQDTSCFAAYGLTGIPKGFSMYRPKASLFSPFADETACFDEEEGAYVFISENLEPGSALNTLAHMTIGTGGLQYNRVCLGTVGEEDLRLLWTESRMQQLNHVTFLDTMHLGPTYREQIDATALKKTEDLKVTGLYVLGQLKQLRPLLALLKR